MCYQLSFGASFFINFCLFYMKSHLSCGTFQCVYVCVQPQLMFSRIANIPRLLGTTTFRTQYNFRKKINIQPKAVGQQRDYVSKRFTYLNIVLISFMFGLCFAGLPLYRRFCEHMGLVGDTAQKTYDFEGIKINNLKKYKVKFTGASDSDVKWQFEAIEKQVVVSAGETAIVFYRVYNKQDFPVVGFATYNISPEDVHTYFSKIQCFCFNQQLINPKEELFLPLFFYLQPQINEDPDCSRVQEISLTYNFNRCAKQDLAKFAADELKRVEQNKRKLNEIRASKMGMSVDDYVQHLQAEDARQAEQNKKIELQSQRKRLQQQQKMLKNDRQFEQDLLKAQLISQQNSSENMYSKPKFKKANAL